MCLPFLRGSKRGLGKQLLYLLQTIAVLMADITAVVGPTAIIDVNSIAVLLFE